MSDALNNALRLLTRREHGAMELCSKLERKGFGYEESKAALEECQRLGFQNDSRFVESYSRSRIRQGYGPLKIIQELKMKGIDPELIQQAVELEPSYWLSHARDIWQKKTKGKRDLSLNELQKLKRFLLYRGFNMDIIAQVVKDM